MLEVGDLSDELGLEPGLGELDCDVHGAPVGLVADLDALDGRPGPLDLRDQRRGALAGRELYE